MAHIVKLVFVGDYDNLGRTLNTMRAGLGLAATQLTGLVATTIPAAVGAMLATIPMAFGALGIAAAAQSEKVKSAFTDMKNHVWGEIQRLAQPFQPMLVDMFNKATATFDKLGPALGAIFQKTAGQMSILADGVMQFVTNIMPGFTNVINAADPVIRGLSNGIAMLGTGMGGFFTELSKSAPAAGAALQSFLKLISDMLPILGQFLAVLTDGFGPVLAQISPAILNLMHGLVGLAENLSAASPALSSILTTLLNVLAELLPIVGQVVAAFMEGLAPILRAIAPVVVELGHTIGDLLVVAIRALSPVIETVLPFLGEMANVVGQALIPVIEALAPVLALVSKELVEALKPILPVIIDGFRQLQPVILEIAQQAGPLLADIIRALAPLLLELVKGALELTQALLPVIPPILEMANNAMPLLAGVIKDVLIPIIKFLVTEFVGLIDYGVKLADSAATLSQRWRTYWDEIKAAFADADQKIRAGIDAWVGLGEKARQHWDAMYQAIKTKISEIVTEVQAFPRKVIDAIGDMASQLAEKGRAAIQGFLDGMLQKFQEVLNFVKEIPGKVAGAIGDTSKTLYNSGSSLIGGFNQGIESQVDNARAAGTVAVDAASNPFPQSPAKEGPFSGHGWTFFRGESLIQGFVDGIRSAAPQLYQQVIDVVGQAQGLMSAGKELVDHISGGGKVFEDLSFQGMSANMGKYNDMLSGIAHSAKASWDPKTGAGSASATIPGVGPIELKVAPGTDSALSSMLMNLVRTGQLQLQKAGF